VEDGISFRVRRVLHGTDFADWGGTAAYKCGLDLLIDLHCDACCGVKLHDGCATVLLPTLRVNFLGANKRYWIDYVRTMVGIHVKDNHANEPQFSTQVLPDSC
jgi:hypothetical protein